VRDDLEWLSDIYEAITNIEKYARRGPDAFLEEELIQVWMRYHFQILGEAARNISSNLREKYPEVPWPKIIAFRNMLTHHYFGIDPQVVWIIITHDLPPLKKQVETILQELGRVQMES
jgi:uncharacterized protein with HEPN domain